ncbi:hypothetical protein ACWV95_07995 [Streptomyces albus]
MATARETLGNALAAAARLGGEAGRTLAAEARTAFGHGIQATGLAGAVLLAVAAVVAWLLLRPGSGEAAHAEDGTREPAATPHG